MGEDLDLKRKLEEVRAFLRRTALDGGKIVSTDAMTPTEIAIAKFGGRLLVLPDGLGFVYVPGPKAGADNG